MCVLYCVSISWNHTLLPDFNINTFLLPVWVSPAYSLALCFQLEMKWEKKFEMHSNSKSHFKFSFLFFGRNCYRRENDVIIRFWWAVELLMFNHCNELCRTRRQRKKIEWNIRMITTFFNKFFDRFSFRSSLDSRAKILSDCDKRDSNWIENDSYSCRVFFPVPLEQQKVNLVEVAHKDNNLFLWHFHRIDGLIRFRIFILVS